MARPKIAGFRFSSDNLEQDLKNNLEAVGFRNHFKKDMEVFVKPNFTLPFFKPGVTTHEVLLESLLGILKDRVDRVYIGESDGGSRSFTAQESLEGHEVPRICARTGAEMLNLSTMKRTKIVDYVGKKRVGVVLPTKITEVDTSVSMPVMKVHVVVTTSLSIKNLWGCHPDAMRCLDNRLLSEKLALIARLINLNFCVLDAISALNVRGPIDGDVIKIGGIAVASNPVAQDAQISRLMGFDPRKIRHLVVANRSGLGPIEEREIDVVTDMTLFRHQFVLKPTFTDRMGALTFRNALLNRIVMDSPFSKSIYWIMRRPYQRKISKPGDEV